ncbi:hypothetical protein [Alkaliphilus transvaalensis]|uniref:hypothetical protein n=1 Tax=Alkaliphilus transvaalensis TaxID=114628 RepID=UPI00047CB7CA|nr:hypothetical protein [Alkaliphilus transvaalensis]
MKLEIVEQNILNLAYKYSILNDTDKQILAKKLFDNGASDFLMDLQLRINTLRLIESINNEASININELYQNTKYFFQQHSNYSYVHLSPIFSFPTTNSKDYIKFIDNELKNVKRKWVSTGGQEGNAVYNKILKQELIVFDSNTPMEINTRCNGVYVIANEEGKVLYVGKRESKGDHVIVRFLDHLVPVKSPRYPYGQPSNNDNFLWDYLKGLSITKEKAKLQCFICFNLNFDAGILEKYLLRCKHKYNNVKTRY